MNLGVTRIGATQTKPILDDYRARRARGPEQGATTPVPAGASAADEGAY
jgi:hypothetical protein